MKNLILYVIAVDQSNGKILNYNKNQIGDNLSNTTQLDINLIENNSGVDDLTIVYDEKTFNHTDLKMLSKYILSIDPKYDTGNSEDISISISYIHEKGKKNKYTIDNIKKLDKLLIDEIYEITFIGKEYIDIDGDHHKSGYIKTEDDDDEDDISEMLNQVVKYAASQPDIEDNDNNSPAEYEPIIPFTKSQDIYTPVQNIFNPSELNNNKEVVNAGYNILENIMGYGDGIRYNQDDSLPDDYDYEGFDIRTYNKDSDFDDVPMSRSFMKSVNTKHNIKNYNMLFVKNKKSLQEDFKVIMKFLKEFLPGNSKWIKEYRKQVAARWIFSLVRTYKQVKKIEKEQQKEEEKGKNKKFRKGVRRIVKSFMPILKNK